MYQARTKLSCFQRSIKVWIFPKIGNFSACTEKFLRHVLSDTFSDIRHKAYGFCFRLELFEFQKPNLHFPIESIRPYKELFLILKSKLYQRYVCCECFNEVFFVHQNWICLLRHILLWGPMHRVFRYVSLTTGSSLSAVLNSTFLRNQLIVWWGQTTNFEYRENSKTQKETKEKTVNNLIQERIIACEERSFWRLSCWSRSINYHLTEIFTLSLCKGFFGESLSDADWLKKKSSKRSEPKGNWLLLAVSS